MCKSKNRNKRCLLCHDCTGESADLSFGDAWLDKYTGTSPGHSVVIARNERAEALLELATRNGDIHLENVGPETVIESQKSLLLKKRNRYLCRLANQILFEKLPEETVGFDRSMNDVIKIFGLIKQFALIKFGI